MEVRKISPAMGRRLRELREARERYEKISGAKVIGAGSGEKEPEKQDMIELVNAVKVAKKWYESLALEAEIMKELGKRGRA